MTLSTNVSAEILLKHARDESKSTHGKVNINSLLERVGLESHDISGFGHSRASPVYDVEPIPKYSIPTHGMEAEIVYDLIHNELALDGAPVLNLASFVHTQMNPQADKLMQENMSKNLIDQDEYPATTMIHARCISMLAKLWHADGTKHSTGTATTGSSEAIQLAGLAMKKRWQEKMIAAGKDERRPGPNIVMGSNAQVALEKFARYFDVEARLVPISIESNYCLDATKIRSEIDENTIGVFVILGSTYTGHYEPVKAVSDLLDEYEEESGNYVPIHVDAASGGLYAPFATPSLIWDFRLPRVVSINTSGHKYGGVYVGIGWIIWRDTQYLPKSMIFELHYLGSIEKSFSLNFSRAAAPVIASYFNFLYLGFEKYRKISLNDARNARLFARAIENSKYYKVVSAVTELKKPAGTSNDHPEKLVDDIDLYTPCLPVVSFRFSDAFVKEYPHVEQRWIQTLLRAKGFIVPNYNLSEGLQHIEILRVVFREHFSEDLVERLVTDLMEVTEGLMETGGPGQIVPTKEDYLARKHAKSQGHHSIHTIKASGHDSVC